MASKVEIDLTQLKAVRDGLTKLCESDWDATVREISKEVAKQFLNRVKKKTPVGVVPKGIDDETYQQYWAGYHGGTLRRRWSVLPVEKQGNEYVVTIINNSKYASYVEYGHRQEPGRFVPQLGKRLKASWVEGKFMMRITEQEIEQLMPHMVEKHIEKKLREVFNP